MSGAQPRQERGDRPLAEVLGRARLAQRPWADVPIERRARIVGHVRHVLAERCDALAGAIGAPNRTVGERIVSEILPLADAARFIERRAARILRPRHAGRRDRPLWLSGLRLTTERVPLGLILIIAPSNYPLMLPGIQMLQALVAGNAVAIKPAPGHRAPLLLLRDACMQAGIAGELMVPLPEDEAVVRDCIDAGVDKVILTGSTDAGRQIAADLAPHAVPSTMELSGSDAVIVTGSADLCLVARALAYGMTFNGGATCIAPRAVYLPADQFAALERLLDIELKSRLPVALPPSRAAHAARAMAAAIARGAAPAAGTQAWRADALPERLRPVVLRDVAPGDPLLWTDLFAPVLALVCVRDTAQAVAEVNHASFALGASVFGEPSEADAIARRLDVGVVTVNDLIVPTADPRLPFGGRGRSGHGVTRGPEGLLEMTRPRSIAQRSGTFRPHYDLPHPGDAALYQHYLHAAHGRGIRKRLSAVVHLVQDLWNRGRPARRPAVDEASPARSHPSGVLR